MKNKKFKKITLNQIKNLSIRAHTEEQKTKFFPILEKIGNEPLSLLKILECTNLHFALRCLPTLPKSANDLITLLIYNFIIKIAHLTNDKESANVIEVYHRFIKNEATKKELNKAQTIARFAASRNEIYTRTVSYTIAWAGTALGNASWTALKSANVLCANAKKGERIKTFNEAETQQKEIFKKWIIENECL